MKFSIITPSYNQGRFIEDTIQSVLNQDGCEIEHIVVDGGSNDSTVEILKEHGHLKWVSEKDRGQSHAINKGFAMATGEIIAWINSDDYYYQNCFRKVEEYFTKHPECAFLYGDITFVDIDKQLLVSYGGDVMSREKLLKNPDAVRQPSCFWRKRVIEEIGNIDESLHLVMDFDFFLRISQKFEMHYIPENISHFRFYPAGKSSTFGRTQVKELKRTYYAQSPESIFHFYRFLWSRRIHRLKRYAIAKIAQR